MAMAVYVVVVDGYGNSCDDGGGCIGGGCNGEGYGSNGCGVGGCICRRYL